MMRGCHNNFDELKIKKTEKTPEQDAVMLWSLLPV